MQNKWVMCSNYSNFYLCQLFQSPYKPQSIAKTFSKVFFLWTSDNTSP